MTNHVCPQCGRQLYLNPQNRLWYCGSCRYYPEPSQLTYQQRYVHYPPQPTLPTRQSSLGKIRNSLALRATTDRPISTMWPALLVLLQVMWVLCLFAGIYLLIIGEGGFFYDPASTFELTAEAVLLILLSFLFQLGLTIIHAYLAYRIVQRRDEHFQRDWVFREGAIEYLGAESLQRQVDLNVERWSMTTTNQEAYVVERERGPVLWGILVGLLSFMPPVGQVLLIYVLHFVTKEQRIHEDRQLGFNHQLLLGMTKTNAQNLPHNWQPMPRRSTALYIILTVLTLTFFLPYWWYVVIADFNEHTANQRRFEDQLMASMQSG